MVKRFLFALMRASAMMVCKKSLSRFSNEPMDYVYLYFTRYFILLCIAVIAVINAVQMMRAKRRVFLFVLIIMAVVVSLSIAEVWLEYAQDVLRDPTLCTLLSCYRYVMNPACILLFIMLSGQPAKGKVFYALLVPAALLLIVYLLPFFPATKNVVFSFLVGEDGSVFWASGDTILRFTPHIISGIYLAYLVFRSIALLKFQHFGQAAAVLTCAAIIVAVVVIETWFNSKGDIHLLNTAIAISVVFYYLYLYADLNRHDPLTGLYNRAVFYNDLPRMSRSITGVIEFDMNGLKYFNDHFGHLEGDKGLKFIAEALQKQATRKMYVYRISGDEFLILCNGDSESTIQEVILCIKEDLFPTKYRVSVGYAVRDESNSTIDDLIRVAEERMYADKAEFYKSSPYDRRKPQAPTE